MRDERQYVSGYLTVHPDGTKHLMIVNKYPATSAMVTLKIPGFTGKGPSAN